MSRAIVGRYILILGVLLKATPLWSAPEPSEVKELAENLTKSKLQISHAEVEKRKIMGSLYSINQRMKKISQEKSHLTDEMFSTQGNVKSMARMIANIEKQIGLQREQLKRRLRVLYKLSGIGYLGIIFSQSNATQLDQSLRVLKLITDADYELMQTYQQNVDLYKKKKDQLRTQVERLVGIEKQLKSQEGKLVREHKAKMQIVSELDAKQIDQLTKIQSIRSKSVQIKEDTATGGGAYADTILELMKPSFFERKGQLLPPVVGQVVQDFGLINNEKFKIQLSHKGWRFAAPRGSLVNSIFDGKIVHAAWQLGYGFTMIVDHGDHYYSVYSHVLRPRVKLGEAVKKGQIIAESSSGTRQYGDGIYFEIRHFSEPENPINWINSKSVQISSLKSQGAIEMARAESDINGEQQ